MGNFSESDPHAGSVVIPETFLDVVLFIKRRGNIRIVGCFPEKSGQNTVILIQRTHYIIPPDRDYPGIARTRDSPGKGFDGIV